MDTTDHIVILQKATVAFDTLKYYVETDHILTEFQIKKVNDYLEDLDERFDTIPSWKPEFEKIKKNVTDKLCYKVDFKPVVLNFSKKNLFK